MAWNAYERPSSDAAARERDAPAPLSAVVEAPTQRTESPPSGAPRPPAPFPAELFDPARYDGQARLEVRVVTSDGSPLPAHWSLSLEPSRVLIGGEHAAPRALEIDDGRAAIVLDDVKLGAYSVRAHAPDYECATQEVELSKPDELDVTIVVPIYLAGYLTGRVVDSDGRPIEGIEVALERHATDERRTLITDANGFYTALKLPDGDYRVFVGPDEGPLAALNDVSFSAPSLHMPDLVTPPLGELSVRVVDRQGNPVAGAVVQGSGLRSGALQLETDLDGRARAPLCTAGQLILYAEHERYAGVGSAKTGFDPAEAREITIEIGP